MKLVYSHPNPIVLCSMSSALNELGIETEIRNDILGGATGEIAPGETWVELWVIHDDKAPDASKRINEILKQPERAEWMCNSCQETNPPTFDFCWLCHKPC